MIIEALLIFISSITGYNVQDIVTGNDGKSYYESEPGKQTPIITNSMSGGSGDKN